MFLVYLGEVVKRAFSPAARLTDGLQIAVASALPAAARFAGVEMGPSTQNDALAYIGLVAVSLIVIRVLWAPYDMWREQSGLVADLKLELTKPERLITEHMAKRKAKNRIKILEHLRQVHDLGYNYATDASFLGYKSFNDACHLVPLSGLDQRIRGVIVTFLKACEFRFENKLPGNWTTDLQCLIEIGNYVDGRTTIEELLDYWPQKTELKASSSTA